MKLPELILASQSPRRAQILDTLGLPYRVSVPKDEEEIADFANVEQVVLRNSRRKAEVCLKYADSSDVIIGADTLVVLGQDVLGKPANEDEARETLQKLSGQTHEVITGISLLCMENNGEQQAAVRTRVTFKTMGPRDIEDYIATREPYDKAGAYAVQGLCSLFIEKIEGSYTNVMGLPIETLLIELSKITGVSVYDWFRRS